MTWSREDLLNDLGLSRRRGVEGSSIRIDKGEIDPRSRGAIAMISDTALDGDGGVDTFDLRYWAISPAGRMEKQNLFQLETQRMEDGTYDITGLWVLGREVSLHNREGVNNVKGAIRDINLSLRGPGGELPNVAQIAEEHRLAEIVAENLPLPGFDKKYRFGFPVSDRFNAAAGKGQKDPLLLPAEAVRPLLGLRANTLDEDLSYTGDGSVRARDSIPQVGRHFEIASKLEETTKSAKLLLDYRETDQGDGTFRRSAGAEWKTVSGEGPDAMAEISMVNMFNMNLAPMGRSAVMEGIGVLNRTHADMLTHGCKYPRMQDHLASYDLLGCANDSSNPPPPEGRFVVTSEGGNNLREIVPGVGEDIGGNCKTAETQWIDPETGNVRKAGVILDFGAYLIKKSSNWTGAVPDVVEKLSYCKDICITHHHLDHIDALIPYAKRGLLTAEHTVHVTREVFEMAKEKFRKMGVPERKWPEFNILDGTGAFDIADENGVKRMTVMYGTDAVPHSARDTPFTVYGRNGDAILGSYTYLGDMRYDQDWFDIYDSPFWDPVKVMSEREPQLNRDHLLPTYSEIDLTSVKREGKSPGEREVEDNLTHMVQNWFHDKHVAAAMIGTADGRRETLLRVINRTARRMTSFGKAVIDIFRIANKHGVNPYLVERPEAGKYTGIADYLQWHAEKLGLEKAAVYIGNAAKAVEEWFRDDKPGTIFAVISGSQGNPIEIESMTYKLSEGRSKWDASAANSATARPADLKDWAIIFTQSAIPGNGQWQRELIERLANRGACVVEAFSDNIRVHNPGKLKRRILRDLKSIGREGHVEPGTGAIVVGNFPAHASGHGRREDFKLWLKKIRSKLYGGHHTDDAETVHTAYDLIEEQGYRHPGALFHNFEQVQITNDNAFVIGRSVPSVVLTKEEFEPGKHYNKRLRATRHIVFDDRSPHHDLGLRGSAGGPLELHFGMEDAEDLRRSEEKANPEKIPEIHSRDSHAKPMRHALGPERLKTPAWKPSLLKRAS